LESASPETEPSRSGEDTTRAQEIKGSRRYFSHELLISC
jgi:hypothetical protein